MTKRLNLGRFSLFYYECDLVTIILDADGINSERMTKQAISDPTIEIPFIEKEYHRADMPFGAYDPQKIIPAIKCQKYRAKLPITRDKTIKTKAFDLLLLAKFVLIDCEKTPPKPIKAKATIYSINVCSTVKI